MSKIETKKRRARGIRVRAEVVQSARKMAELTQAELAVKADVSPKTIEKLESGKGTATLRIIKKVAAALQLTVDEMTDAGRRKSLYSLLSNQSFLEMAKHDKAQLAERVVGDADELEEVCRFCFEPNLTLAENGQYLLRFIRTHIKPDEEEWQRRVLQNLLDLLGGLHGERHCAIWVACELAVGLKPDDDLRDELTELVKRYLEHFRDGKSALDPTDWWQSAIALGKLESANTEPDPEVLLQTLRQYVPFDWNGSEAPHVAKKAVLSLIHSLNAADEHGAHVDERAIVALADRKHAKLVSYLLGLPTPLPDVPSDPPSEWQKFLEDNHIKPISPDFFGTDNLADRCYYCVWLCGHLRLKESRKNLINATGHRDQRIRNMAVEALGKIYKWDSEDYKDYDWGSDSEEMEEVVSALVKRLSDHFDRVRFHAAEALKNCRCDRPIGGSSDVESELGRARAVEQVAYVKSKMLKTIESIAEADPHEGIRR